MIKIGKCDNNQTSINALLEIISFRFPLNKVIYEGNVKIRSTKKLPRFHIIKFEVGA